jgi:hypothetical protein
MQMTPREISNNSKLTQHVSTILPTYQSNQLVIDTMQKLAGKITKDTIKAALVWGQGPTVRVVVLPDGTDGLFNKGMKSNIIFISKKVVEEFVNGKGQRTTPKGELVEKVTITLLHEMTHWADDQDGTVANPGTEEGWEFEKAVWGNASWNGKPPPGVGKRLPFLTGP